MTKVTTIVSGLPRSGTSMMMRMLEAGGMGVVVDNIRAADEDNLGGYYEFEQVKKIKEDRSWLDAAAGKAVKMVSMLLYNLPSDMEYKVIFMERRMSEMLASQKKMLERKGRHVSAEDDENTRLLYEKHLGEIKAWLEAQKNIAVLYVSYNDVVEDPYACASAVARFLGEGLDVERMAGVLDRSMYRNRAEDLPVAGGPPAPEAGELDEELTRERLKSLGYL